MQVTIGPLPSRWVLAWALDAAAAMRDASESGHALPFRVGDEFFESTRRRAAVWVTTARETESFTWTGEIDPDELDGLVRYWHNLARVRRDLIDANRYTPMEPDAECFAIAVRTACVHALVAVGRMSPLTAQRTLGAWPKLSVPAGARLHGVGPAA